MIGETQTLDNGFRKVVLNRIRALKDFGNVKAGDIGGWIECEKNLSQKGDAWVGGDAKVYGNAIVRDNAKVYDNAKVCGNAKVYDNAIVYDSAKVYDNAKVCGSAKVCGNAIVRDNAIVYMPNHVLVIGAIGSRNDFTTFYRGRDGQIMVRCGCFGGTLDTFLRVVDKTHGSNHYADVYRAAAKVAELQINLK
ncbi:MAG: hypothetical protein HFH68_05240 [Lachnospiraceae bacterium]|nr:hypothetical protein [Lachnospiraceae bacterium]